MDCLNCGNKVSELARAASLRVLPSPCCAYCLCEHFRESGRPLDTYQAGRQTLVLRLVKRLAPYQLELFEDWKRRCVKLGVPLTPEEKYSYLSDLLAA
jgi:hypothetical protein